MRAPIRLLTVCATGAILCSGAGLAIAAQQDDSVADQPSIVEDFSYPEAAQVLAQRGIAIVSGDGHMTLAQCGSIGLIEVRSTNATGDNDPDPGHFCFKVSGPTGSLTVNIPNAYQVKGDSHTVTATITVKNTTSTVSIDKNGWTGIGVGSGPDPATLLELDATT